jgi:hypothetical protein
MKKMKKIKSIPVYLLVVVVVCLLFMFSCNEDSPVTPSDGPYQFDSARYNWTTDTIYSQYAKQIFGFDSTHIYIIDNHSLIIFDGKNYSQHFLGDLYFSAIDGLDPQNIYIAGAYPDGNYRFVKWDGVTYQNIPSPSDTNQTFGFTSLFVKSPTEIWLGTFGKLFLYDGLNFTEFLIDSTYGVRYITENEGRILASGRKPFCPDSNFINCDVETFVYQYENNHWMKIDSVYKRFDEPEFYPAVIDKKLYGIMQEGIFNFTGSDFSKIINSPSPYFITFKVEGKNLNELTGVAFSNNDQFFINWNGKKWSKELSDPGGIFEIRNIGEDYYALSECPICFFKFFRKGKHK